MCAAPAMVSICDEAFAGAARKPRVSIAEYKSVRASSAKPERRQMFIARSRLESHEGVFVPDDSEENCEPFIPLVSTRIRC